MEINGIGSITKRKTGEIVFIYNNIEINSAVQIDCAEELRNLYREITRTPDSDRALEIGNQLSAGRIPNIKKILDSQGENNGIVPANPINGLKNLMDFFTEFDFEPNIRFVNTLAINLAKSDKAAKTYIQNYFELIDSPYKKEIEEKMKSDEFNRIMYDIKGAPVTKKVNSRFKLYYGSQGTGKTTIAMREADNKCIVCNSSMLPSDIMEDFKFKAGEPGFHKSALWEAMENGTKIVLDEINLLPFDSLRFLQGILDGKAEFTYKDTPVVIKDGFEVIGTMNLQVNGMTYGLPEPLVDRAEEMKKFKLDAKTLLGAI